MSTLGYHLLSTFIGQLCWIKKFGIYLLCQFPVASNRNAHCVFVYMDVLQVWFHNDRFCSVLFSYNAFPDITSGCHTAIPTSSSSSDELPAKKLRCNYVTATNTIQHLQLLFTGLCYSQQK